MTPGELEQLKEIASKLPTVPLEPTDKNNALIRQLESERLRAKLLGVKTELRKRMHRPIAEQGQYLRAVVAGHARYFAVPCNGARVQAFRFQVGRLWHRTLCRRSQVKTLELEGHAQGRCSLGAIPSHLPSLPEPASDRHDPRREPYAVAPHVRICGGGASQWASRPRSDPGDRQRARLSSATGTLTAARARASGHPHNRARDYVTI